MEGFRAGKMLEVSRLLVHQLQYGHQTLQATINLAKRHASCVGA